MLTKSNLNIIETLVSQALIYMEKGHEEFIKILKEKDKYETMKFKDLRHSKIQRRLIQRLDSVDDRWFTQVVI